MMKVSVSEIIFSIWNFFMFYLILENYNKVLLIIIYFSNQMIGLMLIKYIERYNTKVYEIFNRLVKNDKKDKV